jgi:hypothetical protein
MTQTEIKENYQDEVELFLNNHFGKNQYHIEPINGDASLRRYFRVKSQENNYILMDSSLEVESFKNFTKVGDILLNYDFSAPQMIKIDKDKNLMLLEDFGDKILKRILDSGNSRYNEEILYKESVDCLIEIQEKIDPRSLDLPKYDKEIFIREAMLFIDWYLALKGFDDKYIEEMKSEYIAIISEIFESLTGKYNCLVLRDYHAENIIYLDNRVGHRKIGLLDFQDALVGHKAYDIASLLEDARRDVSEKIKNNILGYYIKQKNLNKEEIKIFLNDYYSLAAQRNLKILGIFARLCLRDKKERYLEYLPRVKEYLLGDLENHQLRELKEFLSDKCKIYD